jgi:hypothetical protein
MRLNSGLGDPQRLRDFWNAADLDHGQAERAVRFAGQRPGRVPIAGRQSSARHTEDIGFLEHDVTRCIGVHQAAGYLDQEHGGAKAVESVGEGAASVLFGPPCRLAWRVEYGGR